MGIIGIVAAMTIPTLITNNQEKGWQTAASTFEAKFGQALKVMNTQNTLAGLGSTENFVAELQRHMKIVKTCDNSKLTECFTSEINGARSVIDVADESTWNNDESKPTKTNTLITADKIGQKTWGTNTMGLQFANGVSAIVAYNPKCTSDPFNTDAVKVSGSKNKITFTTDCVAVVYDTQSFKNPNELHKDIRTSSMATVGDGNCVFKIEGKCVTKAPYKAMNAKFERCDKELTKTHGISSCYYGDDSWAGAVDYCNHVSKLPTLEQLAKVANYLYGVSDISADTSKETYTVSIKEDRLKAINLQRPTEYVTFGIWSNNEISSLRAYTRTFSQAYTHVGRTDRYDQPTTIVFCIE